MISIKKMLLGGIALASISALISATPATKTSENNDDTPTWDVNNPPGKKRQININVTEGTWMSLDVSPDGNTLAFDLLGDIYTLPVSGGWAKNIASGMAWDMQPRFSPDGQKIAFTSDRAGGDNIWMMDTDGKNKTQITEEDFRLLNNPTWSPDGRFIAARKHFTTSRSLGVGEIWLYHTAGGTGVPLVKKPSEAHQKELGEPMFSPDGRYIYYSQNTTPGPIFEYTPSPDGKQLAFVKRENGQTKLFLKNLESGQNTMIFDNLDRDMQETWAVHGVYPNMDWSPDSQILYFWAEGKIHKYNLGTKTNENAAFRKCVTGRRKYFIRKLG